jgi:NAD(P)-dependent dehydrogenase (short-subunit alcohol dehydrogenase family)
MADQDKVAVVTGSAMNIGRAIALHLARDGYRVLVTARQAEHDAQETARLVREAGSEAAVHLADISDPAQARDLMALRSPASAASMCWSITPRFAARPNSAI